MNKNILVTGVNGFVGHHVASLLHDMGYRIVGVGNQSELNKDLVGCVDEYISCDLTNPDAVKKINLSNTQAIINLAAFAVVGAPEDKKDLYNKINIAVHVVLYQECLNQNATPRIIVVSTGAVYDPIQPLPLNETNSSLAPDERSNEYVISKKKAEKSIQYFIDRGLKCIIARPFNHTGPGQQLGFLLPDLSEQIEIAIKRKTPILVGNLKTRRDFTDVRDVAKAYILLATCPEVNLNHSIYNICSGSSISGEQMLGFIAGSYGALELTTLVDPSKIRSNEIMDIYGSRDRITADTGWLPTIPINQMVDDFIAWKKSN